MTVTLPYILLTIILIWGLTLDGAVDGIIVYIKPDFNRMFKFQVRNGISLLIIILLYMEQRVD